MLGFLYIYVFTYSLAIKYKLSYFLRYLVIFSLLYIYIFIFIISIVYLAESFQVTKSAFGKIDILINGNAEIHNDKFWELETDVNLVNQ